MAPTRRSHVTNEEILETVANGYSLHNACEIKGISRSAVYNRRKKDPEFDLALSRLLDSPAHLLNRKSKRLTGDNDNWRENFIVWFKKTGSKETSANAVNKTPSEIQAALDPSSEDYDAEFASLFEDEMIRRKWAIEDNVFRAAEGGQDRPSQRFLLERLDPDKYRIAPSNQQGNQTAVFWFSESGEAKAAGFLNSLFGNNGSEPTTEPRRLLDVTPRATEA